MASRVNTKFVVILSLSIVLLAAGVTGLYVYAHLKSGERLVKQGDALLAEGEIAEAAKKYERAVGKDRTKLEWLEKWRDVLVQITPSPRSEYERQYNFYFSILSYIADIKSDDAEAQIAYLDEWNDRLEVSNPSPTVLESFANAVEERAAGLPEGSEGAKRVLRYRGLANVQRMTLTTVDEQTREQALTDLRNALEADPTDTDAAMGIIRWHLAEEDRFRKLNRTDLEREAREKTREVLASIVEDFSDDPQVLRLELAVKIERLRRSAGTREELRAGVEELKPKAEAVIEAALDTPAEELPVEFLEACRQTVPRVLGADAVPKLRRLAQHMIEGRPENAEVLLASGRLYQDEQAWEKALEEFQKVLELPDKPVSLEGLMQQGQREFALSFQVDSALALWQNAETDEEKAQWLARAKEINEKLRESLGSRGTELLLLRDAKIAMAEEDYARATSKLAELRRLSEPTQEVLSLLSIAQMRVGNQGKARDALRELIERFGDSPVYLERLARVEENLRNWEAAAEIYASLADRFPDNEQYRRRMGQMLTASGVEVEGVETDPVIQTLMDARELAGEGDIPGALAMLEAAKAEHPEDLRIVGELVRMHLFNADRESARAEVDAALAKFPDNESLQRIKIQVDEEDPVAAGERLIAESDADELEQAIQLHQLYASYGRTEQAREAFERARSIAPEDNRVIELGFLRALERGDLAEARDIARRAAELNADELDGQLFQARLEIFEGDHVQAVQTLKQAVERNPYLPAAWRLLAESQTRIGRVNEALESYREAYAGRPNDPDIAKGLARTLVSLNRGEEALQYVSPDTGALRFSPNDTELIDLWLELEAEYGDREGAIDVRRTQWERSPEDVRNAVSLVRLYFEDQQWDKASEVIESLAEQEGVEPLLITRLRAMRAARGESAEAGAEVFRSYIETLGSREDRLAAYLNLGEFLVSMGSEDLAIQAYEAATEYETASGMEASRRLGDFFFRKGLSSSPGMASMDQELTEEGRQAYERALRHYADVIEADIENEQVLSGVLKRHAETSIKLGNFDEAESDVEVLAEKDPDDLQVLVLQAALMRERGNMRGARAALDRAVELYPSEPVPFIQRAMLNKDNPALLSDVIADLDQAAKLRPGLIEPWIVRFRLLKQQGDIENALLELRKGIDANPDSDRLRIMLVRELWNAGMSSQAEKEVLEIAEERPEDVEWLKIAASLMAEGGRFRDAANLMRQVYELDPTVVHASMYLDMLLQGSDDPDEVTINQLLSEVEPEAMKRKTVNSFMLIARAQYALDNVPEAMTNVGRALQATNNESNLAAQWLNQLRILFKNADNVYAFLSDVREQEQKRSDSILGPYLHAVLANQRMIRGADPQQVLGRLDEIEQSASEDDFLTRILIEQTRSTIHYNLERYDEAAAALERGLQMAPQDADMNNNLAYILVEHLGRYEEARPYAEKAAELRPSSPSTIDTLGWLHFNLGEYERAQELLERAVALAPPLSTERAVARVHLGRTLLELGDELGAMRALEEVQEMAGRNEAIADAVGKDIEALNAALLE